MLFLLLVLVVALVAGGSYAAYAWSQQQYFVGSDAGNIAIYRGLPQDVGPVRLSSVYERQDLTVDQLPSYWRDQVQQRITAPSLVEAAPSSTACATRPPSAPPRPHADDDVRRRLPGYGDRVTPPPGQRATAGHLAQRRPATTSPDDLRRSATATAPGRHGLR